MMKAPSKQTARRLAAVLSLALAFVTATTAFAAVVDLGGETVSKTGAEFKAAYNNNTIENGTVTVSSAHDNENMASGVYTIGNGATLSSGDIHQNGNLTLTVAGGTYISTGYITMPFRYGNQVLVLDNGVLSHTSSATASGVPQTVNIGYTWNNKDSSKGKDISARAVVVNGSRFEMTQSGNLGLGMNKAHERKINTMKVDFAVTNSTVFVSSGQIVMSGTDNAWISDTANSYVHAVFGPGADLTFKQIYANGSYPAPSAIFDGATIHWVTGGNSFIGQTSSVSGDIYEIQENGLTVDIPEGGALSCDVNSSALKGDGGIVKVGNGSITWNKITSSGSGRHLFTGPLVVSNGTWSSSVGYAASAFKVDGANSTLTLSGALTAADVALSATDGGTLTLSGATLTDASPDLTLAGGGTTDYFTRDGAVAAYSFDSLTLGGGAVLNLDADATGADTINATTMNVTATAASKANIVINFSAIPATGASFTLFPATSADVFNVTPMFGSLVLPHEVAVVDGNLVLTIVAEDYTWNGSQTNWGDADAWTKGGAAATWSDGNNAIFNTANTTATVAADAAASKVEFSADATVDGTATLTAPVVAVAPGVSATISAPTAGTLSKIGAGTLTLTQNRTDLTTLSEGTLAMPNGATLDPSKLTLGTDPAKPVTLDYGGQTLTANPAVYLGAGMNVTLTNGTFSHTGDVRFDDSNSPSNLTIASDSVLSTTSRYLINTSSEKTINIVGGEFDLSTLSGSGMNVWLMQNSSGRLRINATDGAVIQANGYLCVATGHDSAGLSPKVDWVMVDSMLSITGHGLYLGNRGSQGSFSNYPVTPECRFSMTNGVFNAQEGIFLGNNPTENTSQHGGWYIAEFDNCIVTAKQCRVYGDRPASRIHFNGTTLVANGNGENWITATGFAEGATPVTIGADGLVLDTNGHTGDLKADPQGAGAITKIGSGILHIGLNQTSSSPLVCEGGETYVYNGLSVARAVTVKSGAKFTTKGSGQVTLADIAFESGAELRVDGYGGGVVPIAVTTLTLPANGTVALTKNSNFSQGKYRILEKTGIAVADVQDKLVPATTDNLAYSWSVEGNTLVLTVGNPTGFAWTGFAGDGKMSTDGNWLGNVAPGAGDPADFSAANMAITVEADIDATLSAVTMGSAVVTFTGSLTATSFSDNSKVEVGANSTVTIDGDLEFSSGNSYITHKVGDDGAFVVTGAIRATGSADVRPYEVASSGWIVAKGLENAETTGDKWNFRLNNGNVAKWVVGEDGFAGTQYFWSFNNANSDTTIKADADFTIATWLSGGTSGKGVTLDTSGRTNPAANYTITANCGFIGNKPLSVKGGGTFLCNYTPTKIDSKAAFSGAVAVDDTATLAINAGKYPTTGAITVNSGTTLQVAQSGTVTLGGNLTLKDGAVLGFNYTTRDDPVLNLTGKTVTFDEGETTNVTVGISADAGVRANGGKRVLTTGGKFADATVTLAEGAPGWVQGISVVDGDIVIDVKSTGLMISIQ